MKFLLKFSLFFLISLNAFSIDNFYDPAYYPAKEFKQLDGEFLNDSYFKIGDIVFKYRISEDYVGYILPAPISGFGKRYEDYYYFDKKASVEYCSYIIRGLGGINVWACGCDSSVSGCNAISYSAVKRFIIDETITCQPGENFNTSTGKCVAPCEAGQKWDQATNKCFVDCTDVNKNKWGFTDGFCVDCSSKTTKNDVQKCYCEGIGSAPDWGVTTSKDNVIWTGLCKNGLAFNFKDPKTPDIKDNNKTDPSNPGGGDPSKPGGDKPGGGSGGGNQGGKDNNGTKPGNGGGNGKDNNGTKPGNGGGNGGNNGKGNGDDPTFNADDFNFDGLKAGEDSFAKEFSNAVEKAVSQVDKFTSGVDQFIDNVKGKGMSSISKKSIPTTCSHKYYINFFGKKVEMDFDFCKVVAPASGAFYYLFYVFFFAAFLMLIVKLLIFSF